MVIAGANPAKEIRSLESENLIVTGWVDDMRELAGVTAPAGQRAGQSAGDVEGPTTAGPGSSAVVAVARHWQQQGWL